ncbi:N-acyl amino acid synthase FeeM domain-containing protein [Rhodopirellula sp. SWK7]|uniref:N-acyl amino acid synthase FeeM domain-containing protein n=1 Tax=Rhodopirellula sp. SWK7 TaxID=595460 RepID=UPI0002BE7165|nr:hypothetical protein [Rhodopirellula sp. SWK7]EMI44609.1 long-chain N-acyl amino acid synthase [Rhodopirellula sp. SWK7]
MSLTSNEALSVTQACPVVSSSVVSGNEKTATEVGLPGVKRRRVLDSPLVYRIAHERDELSEAFGLVYRSYLRAGLVGENEEQIRITPFHFLPTTEVFVTRYMEQVVSTVSLVGDGFLGLPLETIYPSEVKQLRANGLRMAEIGCLADRRESPVRFMETFATMGRMLAQAAKVRGYDGLVAATHPRHARLYKRILPFVQIGDVNECPYANGNPAVMLSLRFDDHKGTNLYERFFGSMASALDVECRPWSNETRNYFKQFLQSKEERENNYVRGQLAYAALTGQYPTRVQ